MSLKIWLFSIRFAQLYSLPLNQSKWSIFIRSLQCSRLVAHSVQQHQLPVVFWKGCVYIPTFQKFRFWRRAPVCQQNRSIHILRTYNRFAISRRRKAQIPAAIWIWRLYSGNLPPWNKGGKEPAFWICNYLKYIDRTFFLLGRSASFSFKWECRQTRGLWSWMQP